MNTEQISALWRAAQEAGLSAEQLRGLSISNPYSLQGPVAQRMQSALARTAPAIAQQLLAESGAQMSLQAKAAQMGLTQMTSDLAAEIEAFTPLTPEQARDARVEELIAQLPYGSQGRYLEDGSFVPGQPMNLTAAMELEALAPEKAAAVKLQAQPPVATGGLSEADALWVNQEAMRIASMNMIGGQG